MLGSVQVLCYKCCHRIASQPCGSLDFGGGTLDVLGGACTRCTTRHATMRSARSAASMLPMLLSHRFLAVPVC